MIEIQIINILSLFWKQYFSCCLLHFSNSNLSIYFKTKKKSSKTNKQTRQKKKEEGKKKVISKIWTRYLRLTRPHIATTPLRMVARFGEQSQVWCLLHGTSAGKRPGQIAQTIEPYLTDRKNDSKQSDEIKTNWNQATDRKNNVNAFHGNERRYAIQSRHNSSAK